MRLCVSSKPSPAYLRLAQGLLPASTASDLSSRCCWPDRLLPGGMLWLQAGPCIVISSSHITLHAMAQDAFIHRDQISLHAELNCCRLSPKWAAQGNCHIIRGSWGHRRCQHHLLHGCSAPLKAAASFTSWVCTPHAPSPTAATERA